MRFRILLLAVVAACIGGGVFVGNADAIAFNDDHPCPVAADHPTIFLCPSGETGKAYSLQISARGGCDTYVWRNLGGGMPPGLSLGSGGLISGTPQSTGNFIFWVQIQDTFGNPFWCTDNNHAERQFEIDVLQGLQIQQRQSTLLPGQVGQPYSLQFTAVGGNPSWTYSGTLPAGLSLSSSGALSGTPTAVGDYSFKVTARDGSRSDTQTYSMSVVAPLKVTTVAAPAEEVTVPIELNLAAEGGKGGYTWSAEGLPAGLTLDPTGKITGTATVPSSGDVKLTVTDAIGLKETINYRLVIAPHVSIARRALPVGHVGASYHARFLANGGVRGFTWSILRRLPKGVALVNARTSSLGGTPTKAGRYHVTVQVKDKLNVTAVRTFVLKVK